MLNTIYKDAIKNRENMLDALRGPEFENILKKARQNWTEYEPTKQDVLAAGIDSSFNSTKFQGIELWAVAAVSVKSDGQILVEEHETNLGANTDLATKSSKLEIKVCEQTVDLADLVMMDGSLYSQFMTRQLDIADKLVEVMRRKNNVIFVSKTSNTRRDFEKLGSLAGDIFYYNHITKSPGFSKPKTDHKYTTNKPITSTFVRLSHSTPIIKIEYLGNDCSEDRVKELLDMIYKNSIGGYPYPLKLAHNNCKISSKDLTKMVSLLGLSNEIGSREVLE